MSYCVNCGVELSPSEAHCPLCEVEVINPKHPFDHGYPKPYPQRLQRIQTRIDQKFMLGMLSIFLGMAVGICMTCNYIFDRNLSWSLYILGAAVLVWVWVFSPLMIRRTGFWLLLWLDTLVALGYMMLIERMTVRQGWFVALALPVSIMAVLLIGLAASLVRYGILRRLHIAAVMLLGIGIMSVATEALIDSYLEQGISLDWSWIVLIPMLTIAVLLLMIARRQALREQLQKRLHI